MKLPDGEHLIDGKIYVVKDGEVIEIKDETTMAEVPVEEEVTEEVAMEEEVVEEEVVEEEMSSDAPATEMAIDPAADAEAILAIVNPILEERFKEVLQLIADLRNEITDSTEDSPEEEVQMELSGMQRFSNITNFLKTK